MPRTIVFLWPNAVPYMIKIYEQLAEWGCHVVVYNTTEDKDAPCPYTKHEGIEYKLSDELDYNTLLKEVLEYNPSLVVTSGWAHPKYKKVCTYCKQKKGIPTVCKIDSQFLHTWKQRIGFFISPFIIKPSYTYMLVPGVRQYHFARRLGYDRQHILMNGLSADTGLFSEINIECKRDKYPRVFLFAARLVKEKGLDLLKQAWNGIKDKKGWKVVIVGSGPEKERLQLDKVDGFICHEYLQQKDLVKLTEQCGVYVLSSTYEAWSLTIHEFASAGMPLLCSETCGAVPHFLINGYNGLLFETGNAQALQAQMERFIEMSDEQLMEMSIRSRKLSLKISPEFTAASILSIL